MRMTRRVAAGLLGVVLVGGCGGAGEGASASGEDPSLVTGASAGGGTSMTVATSGAPAGPGVSSTTTAAGPSGTASSGAETAVAVNVPAVDVVDVATGVTHTLASLIATDRPTLLWMWAPY